MLNRRRESGVFERDMGHAGEGHHSECGVVAIAAA